MNVETQTLHAQTLITLLYDQPGPQAMIEITGLAPKKIPIKCYYTDVGAAVACGLDVNLKRYSTFVSVNPRKAESGFEHDVPYVHALGLDIDDKKASVDEAEKRLGICGLPPTAATSSGHGGHFYLKLSEPAVPAKAKLVWERLCKFTGSDPVQNTNRILRLPGTVNWKQQPVWCFMKSVHPERRYVLAEIDAALDHVGAPEARPAQEGIPVPVEPPMSWPDLMKRLDLSTYMIIVTGEKNEYSEKQVTRSEADWTVICHLVELGVSDEMIAWVYANFPVGLLKYRECGAHYLHQTLQAARRQTAKPVERRVVTSARVAQPRFTGGAGDARRAQRSSHMYR